MVGLEKDEVDGKKPEKSAGNYNNGIIYSGR